MAMTQDMEMEFARMKSLGWGIYLDGEKKGEALHALSSIQTLMETMNLSRRQAMEALKISETEYQQYLNLAGEQEQL